MSRSAAGHIAGLPLPVWLVALSIVPLLGGAARLLQLASGDAPAPADLRFSVAPLPVTLHIAAATFYALAGAFQFDSDLRGRWPALHRVLGRVTVVVLRGAGRHGSWHRPWAGARAARLIKTGAVGQGNGVCGHGGVPVCAAHWTH